MRRAIFGLLVLLTATSGFAAGTLTPKESAAQPIQIRDHHLRAVINNGFARTEVTQTFFNPNDTDLEALYSFPVPKSASLSEVTIWMGDRTIEGEVLPADEAEKIYEEEKSSGGEAGLAKKESYQRYEFLVHPVRAGSETKIQFVYYQPLEIDSGVGRYVYPLAEGGTDQIAESFWTRNDRVEGKLTVDIELKSAWPVDEVRLPGLETLAAPQRIGDGHYKIAFEQEGATLGRDVVVYYRLAQNLPGRVEVVAYRPDTSKPGTFMMVLTPGVHLQPITRGADYVFVLDVSGSMEGKLAILAEGVARALGQLKPGDRFRIVTFSNRASDRTRGWVDANAANVAQAVEMVKSLATEGGTNLHAGLALGLENLDADRATSLILVTDGVANEGVIDPREFVKLVKKYDVRIFGFVMGNSANWPLMQVIGSASGGFSASVSNDDDIVGQILLAKSKITHEALHDASVSVAGVPVTDSTLGAIGKVYRGQQLVFFGKYDRGGVATVTLNARLTGADQTYKAMFDFPEHDIDNPELERLWALAMIESIEAKQMLGAMPEEEAKMAIEHLGVQYQLVTDETSMIVLSDERFTSRGIDRRNKARFTIEREAQARRAGQPIRSYRADRNKPMFNDPAPAVDGAGAIDPLTVGLALTLGAAALWKRKRSGKRHVQPSPLPAFWRGEGR